MTKHITTQESRDITERAVASVRAWLGKFSSTHPETPRTEIALLATLVEALLDDAHRSQKGAVQEPAACLIRSRRVTTEARIAYDKMDHYSEWSVWQPAPPSESEEPPASAKVDLRKIAEEVGIRMDLWDMGAASCAYSEGCHGVTRSDFERFAAVFGLVCWKAALIANQAHMQGFVNRSLDAAMSASNQNGGE